MAWNDVYANFDLATGLNDGSSEANAWQSFSAMATGMAAGDHVHLKATATPHTLTADYATSKAGTATSPIWIEGYTTTPGDKGIVELLYDTNSRDLEFTGARAEVTYRPTLRIEDPSSRGDPEWMGGVFADVIVPLGK